MVTKFTTGEFNEAVSAAAAAAAREARPSTAVARLLVA
jgi:hypothetical protein